MNKKDLVLSTLEKMGYSPEVDDDGDIMICYQLKNVYVTIGEEDDPYLCVILPQFYEIEEGEETVVLVACNKITREIKMAKVFVDQTFKNVSASCEFFYVNEEALEFCLEKSLQMLGVVRSIFRNDLQELKD